MMKRNSIFELIFNIFLFNKNNNQYKKLIDNFILEINDKKFKYFDLNKAAEYLSVDISKTPISIKIIIENLLRNEDGENVTKDMISKVFNSLGKNNKKDDDRLLDQRI